MPIKILASIITLVIIVATTAYLFPSYSVEPLAQKNTITNQSLIKVGTIKRVKYQYPQEGAYELDNPNYQYRLKSKIIDLSQYIDKEVAITGALSSFNQKNILEVSQIEIVKNVITAKEVFKNIQLQKLNIELKVPVKWLVTVKSPELTTFDLDGDTIFTIESKNLMTTSAKVRADLKIFTPTDLSIIGTNEKAFLISSKLKSQALLPLSDRKKLLVFTYLGQNIKLLEDIINQIIVAPVNIKEPTPTISTWSTGAIDLLPPESTTQDTTTTSNTENSEIKINNRLKTKQITPSTYSPDFFKKWFVYTPRGENYTLHFPKNWYFQGLGAQGDYLNLAVSKNKPNPAIAPQIKIGKISKIITTGILEQINTKKVYHRNLDLAETLDFNYNNNSFRLETTTPFLKTARAIIFSLSTPQ